MAAVRSPVVGEGDEVGAVCPFLAHALAFPRWSGVVVKLRTCREQHIVPTAYWREDLGSVHDWTTKDLLIAEALHLLEMSVCTGCGVSSYLGHSPLNLRYFGAAGDVTCWSCAELEELQARDRDSEEKPKPGRKYRLLNTIDDGRR